MQIRTVIRNLKLRILSIFPVIQTKILYKKVFKRDLDLKVPKTFNEKIIWIKLYGLKDKPIVITCADKFLVREYIKSINCEEILVELYGVWDKVEEIEWDKLPQSFVIKCNHDCGYNLFCNDKNLLDIEQTKNKISKWMSNDISLRTFEYYYKKIPRKIICEKLLNDSQGNAPIDFKFFCFYGKIEFLLVCKGRDKGKVRYYAFDRNWTSLNYRYSQYGLDNYYEKPEEMDRMMDYAESLSQAFPFVRMDFYLVDSKIYLGEFTFTPSAGFDADLIYEVDQFLGEKLNINDYKNSYFV